VAETSVPFRYCPSCGERVYTYSVLREGVIEIRCSPCGFPVSPDQPNLLPRLDSVVIADDDRFFLSLLADLLMELGIANSVVPCESGAKFLTAATERLRPEPRSMLAILDIVMEPMDGIVTALAFRAVEEALQVAHATPILFLSAARYETLGRQIGRCQPALYLNKGMDATPAQLGPRLQKVIGYLLAQGRR
jgi:CheY-like chemotaxis protein